MNLENRRVVEKIEKLLEVIRPRIYRRFAPLPPFRLRLLGSEGEMPFPEGAPEGSVVQPGEVWGPPLTSFVLTTTFRIPEDWDPALLYLPLGDAGDFNHPEALVYVDGVSWSSCDRNHHEIFLNETWMDGKEHSLQLHGWTGGIDLPDKWKQSSHVEEHGFLLMQQCSIVHIDEPTRGLYTLASAALGVVRMLDEKQTERSSLLHALDDAVRILDTRNPVGDAFYASVPDALSVLQDGIRRSGASLDVDVTAVGHAHIDVAWLWTLEQARQKSRRSFSNVIRLMEKNPDFTFVQSQAQLYDYIRQDDPLLFRAIQDKAREGQWEPVGGMWVESDMNLIGPESMVRQFLLGRRFFDDHLPGHRSRVLWLPDVFGFNWSLPQLAREAGLDYMFTIKMGWNEFNILPFESFWWQGLDGSRLLTHFSPVRYNNTGFAGTYNAHVSPEEVVGGWEHTHQKDSGRVGRNLPQLMSYGYGDGGGGPTQGMVENIRLFADFPGVPRLKAGSAEGFFRELESEFGASLPVWNDELYLEYHRGTYTSQARTKQANRRSEFAMHDAEFLGAAAAVLDPDYSFPQDELLQAWKLTCLNQFHDILPGSSIDRVYELSNEQYAEVSRISAETRQGALQVLAGSMGGDLIVVNPTGFSCDDPVFLPGADFGNSAPLHPGGEPLVMQKVSGGVLLEAGLLPSYSLSALQSAGVPEQQVPPAASPLSVSRAHLENEFLRLEFSPEGNMVRVYDKDLHREVLSPGLVGNELQLFEDRPAVFEAWDISAYYEDRKWLPEPALEIEVTEEGPVRAALRIVRRIHHSTITQEIRLRRGSRRIDFQTEADWQERQMLLKVAFPVEVLAPRAEYEIQWGSIERPTHRNTSWDWAKFEVPAQKWVDLSEGEYGVSLLNDSKYGHDIHENVIRLSLLRAPNYPDPGADHGIHRFCYSLLPHTGSRDHATAAQAAWLNDPLIGFFPQQPGSVLRKRFSMFQLDAPNLVVETVKPAEDGRGFIVRLYESGRSRGEARISICIPALTVWRTTILEEDRYELDRMENSFGFSYTPFEVITLRVIPGVIAPG